MRKFKAGRVLPGNYKTASVAFAVNDFSAKFKVPTLGSRALIMFPSTDQNNMQCLFSRTAFNRPFLFSLISFTIFIFRFTGYFNFWLNQKPFTHCWFYCLGVLTEFDMDLFVSTKRNLCYETWAFKIFNLAEYFPEKICMYIRLCLLIIK